MVEEADKLSGDTEGLDKTAGSLRKKLDDAAMSAVMKAELRPRIEGTQKRATEAKRKQLQKRIDGCIEELKVDVKAALQQGQRVLVFPVDNLLMFERTQKRRSFQPRLSRPK